MAKAYKCDRCGAFYADKVDRNVYISDYTFNAGALDLCEKCQNELEDWLYMEDEK